MNNIEKFMKKIYLLFGILFSTTLLIGQRIDSIRLGGVNLYQPHFLTKLVRSHKASVSTGSVRRELIVRGYAVQIMNSTKRNDVFEAKSKFLSMYPNIKTDLIYQVPYYRLHIGEFVERKDAEVMLNKLRGHFNECFIVRQELKIKQTNKPKEDKVID